MTFRRRTTVLAASSLLLLAGCAVPGQEGAPGVAIQGPSETLTSAELDAIVEAWEADSDGALVPSRQAIATSTVLGPSLIEVLAEAGTDVTDGIAADYAGAWLAFAGVTDPEPSEEVVASVKNVLALYAATAMDPTGAYLAQGFETLPEDLVFSPRLGELSPEATLASAQAAYGDAESTGLGNYAFTAYLAVDGFVEPEHGWAARG